MNDYTDRFTALIDANVLACALSRNIALSLAEAGLYRPRWSSKILDETVHAIARITKGHANTVKQRQAIEQAFPESCVSNYQQLENCLTLPDPDDRHVLAAAIKTAAQVIVTKNLKDFPKDTLSQFDIEPKSPDIFFAEIVELDPKAAIAAIRKMRERFRSPQLDSDRLLERMKARGLFQTAEALHGFKELI